MTKRDTILCSAVYKADCENLFTFGLLERTFQRSGGRNFDLEEMSIHDVTMLRTV